MAQEHMSSPPGGHSTSATHGSLFGSALTSLSGLNYALWSRLETAGDVSDDCMSLASLTLDDAPGVNRVASTDSRDMDALDAQIAEQSLRATASATPVPMARQPRPVTGNLSSESIPENLEGGCSGLADPIVDSYVQFDDARNGGPTVAYCWFQREGDEVVVQAKAPNGRLLRNVAPVYAKPVHCDAVVWSPLLGYDGAVGHCFFLELNGVQQSRIEAFFGDDSTASCEPSRIAVVNALSTPMAVAANLVGKGSMVEFAPPRRHAGKLKKLLDRMTAANNADDLYCPVSEVALGPALHSDRFRHLLQRPQQLAAHAHFEHALMAWEQAVAALRLVSDETRRGVSWHNQREVDRAARVSHL